MSSPNSTQNIPPEISLDNEIAQQDLIVLKQLSFLQIPPTKDLNLIIGTIIENPDNVPSHMDLSRYLYNRYKAQTEKNSMCFNCIQTEKSLQQLQKATPDPISNDIAKIINHSFLKPSQFNYHQQITDYRNMCDQYLNPEQNEIFSTNFKNDINSLNTDLINALNRGVKLLQTKDQEIDELKHLTSKLQETEKKKNSEISDYSDKISQLTRELKQLEEQKLQIVQQPVQVQNLPIQMQNPQYQKVQEQPFVQSQIQVEQQYQPIQIQNPQQYYQVQDQPQQFIQNSQLYPQQPYQPQFMQIETQPQQSLQQSLQFQPTMTQQVPVSYQNQQSFISTLISLLSTIPTPTLQKTFQSNQFAQTETLNKTLQQILQETISILNNNDIIIQNNNFTYTQYSDTENQILNEVSEIIRKVIKIRYGVESQIETDKNQKTEPVEIQPVSNQFQHFTSLQSFKSSFQRLLKSLFAYSVPEKSLRQSLGVLSNSELNKILNAHPTPNFIDIEIVLQLNEIQKNVDSGIETSFEQLTELLSNNINNSVLVPKVVLDLAQLSLQLEEKVKSQLEESQILTNQIQDLKSIIQNEQQFSKEKTQKILDLERENTLFQTQLNDFKNQLTQLQIENQRISGMEKIIDTYNVQLEQHKFDLSSLQAAHTSLENEKKAINEFLAEKSHNYEILSQKHSIVKQRVSELELELNNISLARKEALQKNKELVNLAREMESQIKSHEQQINTLNIQLTESESLQQQAQKLKKIISASEISLEELTATKNEQSRTITSQTQELQNNAQQIQLLNQELVKNSTENQKYQLLYNNINLEVEEISKICNNEKERNQLLGENLDQISALNVQMTREITDLTAKNEVLKKENDEVSSLLEQINTNYNIINNQNKELEQKMQTLLTQQVEKQEKYAVNSAENELLKRENVKLKTDITDVIEAKNKAISENISTMQSIQGYSAPQNSQLQTLQLEQNNSLKKLRKLEEENKYYIDNIQQITEIQNKLAVKSKKILGNYNKLKGKICQFVNTTHRICKCSGGKVNYEVENEIEIEDLEINKITMLNEDQIRVICWLVEKGVENENSIEKIKGMESQIESEKQMIQQLQSKIQQAESSNKSLKQQQKMMNQTIQMVGGVESQNEIGIEQRMRERSGKSKQIDEFVVKSGKSGMQRGLVDEDESQEVYDGKKNSTYKSYNNSIRERDIERDRNQKQSDRSYNSSLNDSMDVRGDKVRDSRNRSPRKDAERYTEKQQNNPDADRYISKNNQQISKNQDANRYVKDANRQPKDGNRSNLPRPTHYSPSDSTGKDIINILNQYQPKQSEILHSSHSDEIINVFKQDQLINPVNVQISSIQSSQTPMFATNFDETVRSYQSKNDRSLLSGEEKMMIQRLLGQK